MRTARLLASRSSCDSLHGILKDVAKLEGLHKITCTDAPSVICDHCNKTVNGSRVPDHAPILDANIVEGLVDCAQLLHTLVEGLLSPTSRNIAVGPTE